MKSVFMFLFMSSLIAGCASASKPTVRGIPNFGEIAPGIYRGGQPASKDGWDYLKSLGVVHVLKLNTESEGADDPRFQIERYPITLSHQIIFEPSPRLIEYAVHAIHPGTFVHCSHGQDRTGLIVGEYRVRMCGWSHEAAWREMREYGFHPILFGLERAWEEAPNSAQ